MNFKLIIEDIKAYYTHTQKLKTHDLFFWVGVKHFDLRDFSEPFWLLL